MTTTRPTDPTDRAAHGTARRSARIRRFVLGAVVATAAGGLATTAAFGGMGGVLTLGLGASMVFDNRRRDRK